jgi:ferritin
VYGKGEILSDRYFNLPDHLPSDSLLIINNSKVIEARLHFRKNTGGQLEVFCLEHGDKYPDVSTAMQQKGNVEWICQIGGAKKWKEDAEGEMAHAGWAKAYLLDMGVQPTLPALPKPEQTFAGIPDIIRKSYDHEIMVTNQCNDLGKEAMKTADHLLYQLANKFLQEQQEELGKLQTLLDKLAAFGEDKIAMRLLDDELAG